MTTGRINQVATTARTELDRSPATRTGEVTSTQGSPSRHDTHEGRGRRNRNSQPARPPNEAPTTPAIYHTRPDIPLRERTLQDHQASKSFRPVRRTNLPAHVTFTPLQDSLRPHCRAAIKLPENTAKQATLSCTSSPSRSHPSPPTARGTTPLTYIAPAPTASKTLLLTAKKVLSEIRLCGYISETAYPIAAIFGGGHARLVTTPHT